MIDASSSPVTCSRSIARQGAFFVAAWLLSGCGIVPIYPVAPALSDQAAMAKAPEIRSQSLGDAERLIAGWSEVYKAEGRSRRNAQIGFSESLLFGSVFAVAGALADRTGLRNAGAGVAGLSSIGQSHYQLVTQAKAFERAASRLDCLSRALMPLDPRDESVVTLETPELKTTLWTLPATSLRHLATVRDELRDALNNIELVQPTREAIVDAVEKYKAAKTTQPAEATAAKQAGPVARAGDAPTAAELLRRVRFVKALASVEADMQLCLQEPQK